LLDPKEVFWGASQVYIFERDTTVVIALFENVHGTVYAEHK
jgi:hypothetical protein